MDFLEKLPAKSKDEIAQLSKRDLDDYVKECSIRILESIDRAEDKLERAKSYGCLAESMESGGFFGGKTKRKTDMTAIALSQTNDAMNELTLLQRETIQFICVSLAFAQKMNESISYMIEYGFTDRDGQVQHLTDDSKKIARKILDESQKYAQNQLEQQKKDLAQDKHLNKLEGKIAHISELNNQHEQKFQEHEQKFQEKDELDEKQDHNISVLNETVNQLKNDEIANIAKFDNEINSLEIKLKELKINFDNFIENENKIISTRLTNYINDNNESLKGEFNSKIDSITGNASKNESQISLLTNQLSELKADYQKSVEENKAFLNTAEATITALSEKIEEQNKKIQLLNEKFSSYENNTKILKIVGIVIGVIILFGIIFVIIASKLS